MYRARRRIKWCALEISDSERRAILDGYYNDIQKRMAKFPIYLCPTSLLIEIFKRVPVDDIRKLRLVCRSWYSICAAAVDKLPKPEIKWLELKVSCVKSDDTESKGNTELALMNFKRSDLLWSFADFGHIFNDIRMSQLIFCGFITFTWNTPVSQYLPSLLTLKDRAQFRPKCLLLDRSDMTNVTEQQLINCVSYLSSSLKLLELHDLQNSCPMSDMMLANLVSVLPHVVVDMSLFNDAAAAVSNALAQWLKNEPHSFSLHLCYVPFPKALNLKASIQNVGGEQFRWFSQVVGEIAHPCNVVQSSMHQFTDQFGLIHKDSSLYHSHAFQIALNHLRVSVKEGTFVNLSEGYPTKCPTECSK